MPKIAYNDAGDPFIADDGTYDVPRLPIADTGTDWSNLITGVDPDKPTLFPGIRSGLSQAGKLLTGEAQFSTRQDVADKLFGSHYDPSTGKAVAGNRLKTWPEQMITNAIAGDPASNSINPQTGEIHTSPETIERALDISGMAGGGVLGAKADVRPPLIDWENWGKTSNPIERFQDMARQNQQGVVNGRLMSDTSDVAPISALAKNNLRDVYHATTKKFDKFNISSDDIGVHFGTQEQANDRGRSLNGENYNIIPAKLDLKNPLRLPDLVNWKPQQLEKALLAKGFNDVKIHDVMDNAWKRATEKYGTYSAELTKREQYEGLRNLIKEEGYDGIVYKNEHEGMAEHGVRDSYIAFDPRTQVRNRLTGQLMSDTSQPGAAIAAVAPRFYSALENAVKDSRTKTASADQWLGELRNKPGVKQEELDWVLHDLPEGQISKQAMEEYVNSHKVELKEVTKQNYTREQYDEMNRREQELIAKGRDATEAEKQEWADIRNRLTTNAEPNYKQWQLPGGENYREHLLTLPEKKGKINIVGNDNEGWGVKYPNGVEFGNYTTRAQAERVARSIDIKEGNVEQPYASSHFGEPNILTHIRTNERSIPGVGNSLHVEEIQSDWHQAGRKQGYKGELNKLQPEFDKIEAKIMASNDESILADPELPSALKKAIDKKLITADEAKVYKRYSDISLSGSTGGVPDAPFKTSWPDLALKRIIREAAETGKDAVSWTPGEAQALRYQNDVRQKLNSVDWHNKQMGKPSKDGSKQILVDTASGGEISLTVSKEGTITGGHNELKGKRLDSVLGKDIASQILDKDEGNINAKGYVMNSEPMKAFYDKMLVDKANAIAKKFGGKVEQANLATLKPKAEVVSIRDGQEYRIKYEDGDWGDYYKTKIDAENALADINKQQPIHVLRITPQLRDAALNKGFSLFADSGRAGAPLTALTRVNHDPFKLAEMEKQHGVSLTPVEHNPFTTDAYHGSPNQFRGTEIAPSIRWAGNSEFYSTPNPNLANEYAAATWYGGKQKLQRNENVTPLKLDTRDYHVVDAKGKYWHEINDQAIFDANQMGKKGVIVKDVYDGTNKPNTIYITLDPSTVRSRFAKFDPRLFGESGLLKSAGIPLDISNQDGKDPFIDNSHTVPYGAGASNNGFVVHIDSSIPRFDAHTGDLDLYKPLALHERTEKKLMDAGMPYEYAHKIATQAEKGLVGDKWNEYEKIMDGYLKHTEKEDANNPPPDLYLKPYPHDKQELLKRNADHESMTHSAESPDSEDVGTSGKMLKLGAAKAAEWGAFVAARNYPKIAGPMYASWVAQWPILGHMLKNDVKKQLKAGVKPEDIEFKPGSIGDLFGVISGLQKKYGDKAHTLEPIEGDPFAQK